MRLLVALIVPMAALFAPPPRRTRRARTRTRRARRWARRAELDRAAERYLHYARPGAEAPGADEPRVESRLVRPYYAALEREHRPAPRPSPVPDEVLRRAHVGLVAMDGAS